MTDNRNRPRRTEREAAIDAKLGRRLRARRIEVGLSLRDVADACDIALQQMQKYESGMDRVSVSRLYSLAKVLRFDPTKIIANLGRK